jgi:L-asparaginase / beta-aspartyl-peptidase
VQVGRFAIIVHGGAGARGAADPDRNTAGCLAAARAGHAILQAGGTALDAVQAAAIALEDDPVFNAGTGAALNADGDVEHDALLMDGATLRAGGVGALRGFQNPIVVARAVLDGSPHCLLAGEGAARFARAAGIVPCADPRALITDNARRRWEEERAKGFPGLRGASGGTIGAVALDRHGHVAAATSTGGLTGKHPGRIGDTPLLGAGTYADDASGAASATGHGEAILTLLLTKHACDRIAAGAGAQGAVDSALSELGRVHGHAGLICISAKGELGIAFNTERMARAWIDANGREGVGFGA